MKSDRVIWMLVVAALGALTFTCAGGLFVFLNTQHFEKSNAWLDHTHSVIESLQQELLRLDRIETSVEVFKLTGNEENIRFAQGSIVTFSTALPHIAELVHDNASQTRHVQDVRQTFRKLSDAVEEMHGQQRTTPDVQLRECRGLISTMLAEEHDLLDQRTLASQRALLRNYIWAVAYVLLSLLVLIAVFGIVVRDTLRRKTSERHLSLANNELAVSVEALGQRVKEASLIKNVRDELQLCVTAKEAYECAARHLEHLVPGSSVATMVINNSRSMLMMTSSWNKVPELLDGCEAAACCGLRAGRPRWRRGGESEIHCGHFLGTPPANYMCIPLSALSETLGFVYVSLPSDEVAKVAESRMSLINELVELAAMATAGLNLRAKLENQSIRDPLTKLFNRRFMEIALERELQRATRHCTTLSLLMLDVDHFKNFNDTFGHEAGDLVLKEIADCLQSSVRSEDIVCRYGGEEFVIILPEISEEMAMMRADAIRERVLRVRMQFGGETMRNLTISVGLAMYPNPAQDATDLLRMADRGLYQAKSAGRNMVRMIAA